MCVCGYIGPKCRQDEGNQAHHPAYHRGCLQCIEVLGMAASAHPKCEIGLVQDFFKLGRESGGRSAVNQNTLDFQACFSDDSEVLIYVDNRSIVTK